MTSSPASSPSEALWQLALSEFDEEFGYDAAEIVNIQAMRELFVEKIDKFNLSENSAIALFFGIYFFGYLTLLEMTLSQDPDFKVEGLDDFLRILHVADARAALAHDSDVLAQAARDITDGTQRLMEKLQAKAAILTPAPDGKAP